MIFIAFLRAHSGEVYLNNFMQGKVDVSRVWAPELQECRSRTEVQDTPGGPPTLGSSSSHTEVPWAQRRGFLTFFELGRLFLGCSSWKQGSCSQISRPVPTGWDPSPIPAGRCVVPTLFFSCLQTRNGAFSDALSKCCLKTCAGTLRGVIVCMNQSRAFWMHQTEQDVNYYFFH